MAFQFVEQGELIADPAPPLSNNEFDVVAQHRPSVLDAHALTAEIDPLHAGILLPRGTDTPVIVSNNTAPGSNPLPVRPSNEMGDSASIFDSLTGTGAADLLVSKDIGLAGSIGPVSENSNGTILDQLGQSDTTDGPAGTGSWHDAIVTPQHVGESQADQSGDDEWMRWIEQSGLTWSPSASSTTLPGLGSDWQEFGDASLNQTVLQIESSADDDPVVAPAAGPAAGPVLNFTVAQQSWTAFDSSNAASVVDDHLRGGSDSSLWMSPQAGLDLVATGFEATDGFSTGYIGGQVGWTTFDNNTDQPVISAANPSTNSQHLRLGKQSGLAADNLVAAFGPDLGTQPAGHYRVSYDLAISATGGADYYLAAQSLSQGALTAQLVFSYTGDILVRDNRGSGINWYDTGVDWSTGAYRAVSVDIDADANTIDYYYDGSLVASGVVWGGTSVEQVILYHDNYNAGDVADIDNLVVESISPPQPDLVNARLTSWNDLIPVGIVRQAGSDPHSYSGPYYDNQTLYFNWLATNFGNAPANNYTVRFEVAEQGGSTWQWTGVSTAPGDSVYLTQDQALPPLSAGTHTLRVWLDHPDGLAEADELNNYYERTITVLPVGTPAARDVVATPLGISAGVSWFQTDGQITDFGGHQVVAVDLLQGQRLSASVQTPEAGGVQFSNSSFVAIADSGGTTVSEITIPAGLTIDDLDVSFFIDHLHTSDLDIFLVSPSGTRIELSRDNGGAGNHYLNTILDDEAPVSLTDTAAAAPFWGRLRPESSLSVFDGTDPGGVWRLEITDDTSGNSPDGLLRGWSMRLNQGLDVALRISGPDGILAQNDSAITGLRDAAVNLVTIPTSGRYLLTVENPILNVGQFTVEAGIYEATVTGETGDTTDLQAVRAANGNVSVLGQGDGIGQDDLFTITLNAGEAVNVAATTPGGFHAPYVTVTGPNGFDAGLPFGGPHGTDTAQMFTAPTTGTYTVKVEYPYSSSFRDAISTGTYVLTASVSDNATNGSVATGRPISSFDYREQVETTSWYYGVSGEEGLWRGTIDPAGEADYFALGSLAAGQLIRGVAQREATSQVFPLILLVDGNLQIVTGGRPLRSPGLEGIAFFETIVDQADDYTIVVLGDTTTNGGSTFSQGAYQLFYADFGVTEDPYEQNDSKTEVDAQPAGAADSPNLGVVAPVTMIDNLAMMEDSEDYFRFETSATATRGDYIRIEFSQSRGNLNLDLLDAAGNLLRRSQRLGDTEHVTLHGLPAGSYYARVWGQNGAHNPRYDLRIQTGAPDQRLLSPSFTTDDAYAFAYEIGGAADGSNTTLESGLNELVVTTASGGPLPFEMIFDVQQVGSLTDQENYQYDLLGNLSRRTDALRQDTVYEYDALGRPELIDGPQLGDASAYVYDANDNLVEVVDVAGGSTQYEYDPLNRLTRITMPNGLGNVQYTYDLAGRVASIIYPNGGSVGYVYDAAGRLQQVTDGADVTTYAYDASGHLASMTQPNGVTADYAYDDYGRLTDLVYENASGRLVTSFHYSLDANGNRTAMEVRRPDGGTPELNDFLSGVYEYAYDTMNRLVETRYPDGSIVVYTFDDNGNRLTTSTDPDGPGAQPAVVETYHHGYDNRLEYVTDSTGARLREYHYDPRGNVVLLVTPSDTTRYEYDYRNLLTVVENSATRIEYQYDGNGDRVAQVVNGERTTFVNDPNREFTQVLAELDSSGAAISRYTYGLGRISGQLPGDAATRYYVTDALGSTTDLLDASGDALQSYSYDAYGLPRETDPAGGTAELNNVFAFTGENYDSATELIYLRARYYDPSTGRFLSKDPSGFVDGPNVYGYVNSVPTQFVDPSGEVIIFDINNDPNNYGSVNRIGPFIRFGFGPRSVSSIPAFLRTLVHEGTHVVQLLTFQDFFRSRLDLERNAFQVEQAFGHLIPDWFPGEARESAISSRMLTRVDQGLYRDSNVLNRGGVLLNRAVDFVGDLKSISGATVDPTTGQVVLLGSDQGGATVPGLLLDDFMTAVRAIYGSAEDPGVTIDPQSSDPSVPQLVHLFGGLDNTELGYVLFEADRVMKSLAARRDNITGNAVGSNVSGYKSMLDRWFDRDRNNGASGNANASSRFWFVPSDVKLVRSDDGQSFVFDRAAVQLLTEDNLIGNGEVDPDAQAFTDWFNANFAAIAAEQYAYPSLPGYEFSFQRLEQAARAIAFARFLYDNNIPIDFSWMEHYQPEIVVTPATTPTVVNSRTESWDQGLTHYTLTHTITGGVTLDTPNTYVNESNGLQGIILGARPNELVQHWDATLGGTTQKAVALSTNTGFVDGLVRRADVDLAYRTPGDMPLSLTRYYNSAEPVPGPFGYGWEFVPYDIDFTNPEFFSSTRAPQSWQDLNGLHEGELRVEDRMTGEVLTFLSTFVTAHIGGGFAYGGLNDDDVPDFIAAGSEEPDGSTLVQDPATLGYTLTRPDGSRRIFDAQGKLLRSLDHLGRAITYTYAGGRVSRIEDGADQTIDLTYDQAGRVTKAIGLGGEETNYTYSDDGLGNLLRADRVRDGVHSIYAYSYDATEDSVDDHLLFEVTTPDQVLQSKTWSDILGRASASEDARGNRFEQSFDPQSRTTVTTDAIDGSSRVVQTDSLGRPRVVEDELGRVTQFYYDVERVFGPQYPGGWTFVQYINLNSRQPSLIQMPDPNRPWLFAHYDDNGNLIRLEDISRGGDADQDGIDDHPQLFQYDAANNLVQSTDARGIVSTFTYQVLDAGTADQRITNRRTSMTRGVGTPFEATWQWQYEAETGYLLSETDPTGLVTQYAYDALGNVQSVTTAVGTADQVTTAYAYDAFSRLTSITDGAGRRTDFQYDGRDQITTTRLVGTTDLESHGSYDSASGRKLSDTDFVGNVVTYQYDTVTGDLIAQTGADGTADENTTTIVYDRFGKVDRVTDPVGNGTVFDYDRLQRLVYRGSLGSTTRVVSTAGTNSGVLVQFSDPIDGALVDNAVDLIVRDSNGQAVAGSIAFNADGTQLTWDATSSPLAKDTYTITLLASAAGQFANTNGQRLDGEYFGDLPSGDNLPGGDFVLSWFVDDHGNDAPHSTPVAVPSSTPGILEFPTDQDWFGLDAVAGSRFGVEVLLGTQSGALFDSELALYDQDGTTVLVANGDIDAASGKYGSLIEWEAPRSGRYFLKVTSNAGQFSGSYELAIRLLGDDHSDAAPGTVVAIPSVTPGGLEVATDVDTFSFDAQVGKTYRVTTILDELPDATLVLLDVDNTTVLASNDNYYANNPAAFLYWTAPADGRYHVQVGAAGSQDTGSYELALSIDDHGDYAAEATAIGLPSTTLGDLEVKFDGDWFALTTTAGNWYRFEANADSLPDPFLALFSDTQLLASSDNYLGNNARIFWQAPTSDTYYLKVSGHDGSGTYELTASELTDDHGNFAAAATLVTVPSSTPGNIEIPSDPDWFAFDLVADSRYRIESILDSLPDSVLTLYDSDGTTQLDRNDDFRGPGSRIDFTAADSARFYAAVTSFNGSLDGTYDFDLLQLETQPPTGNLVSPVPGGSIHSDPGYVDILWSDGAGSGMDVVTIDKSDVTIAGVSMTSVEDLGGGVWRYHYQGGLQDGDVDVVLPANHVSDLHGNWNLEATATFTYAAPTLTVTLNLASIAETAGDDAARATIRRINVDDISAALVVTLTGDASEIGLPSTITIPADADSIEIPVDAVDDDLVDGTQLVTITAAAAGFMGGAADLQVSDHGDLEVVIAADAFFENAGAGATTATVRRSDGDDLSAALTVTLSSDKPDEAIPDASVQIPALVTIATFAIDAVDDAQYDGTQTVNITASASQFNPGSDTVNVLDHEIIPPALSSNPGAPATIYLDFDGHTQSVWGSYTNATTPVFDQNNVPNLFTNQELAAITNVWQRVAEDFAPFDINVTTVDPGDFSNGKGLRVVVGGSSEDWFEPQGGSPAGGVAYLNSFTNGFANVVYVFSEKLGNAARYIAEAASHESGHAFGLRHQSLYDSNGAKLEEYHPGNANWAPIMGVSYYSVRSTWHNGPNAISSTTLQDDTAILSGGGNGYGPRDDDHGNDADHATAMQGNGSLKTADGIIETLADVDFFSFTTGGGQITVALDVAAVGPNLDSILQLRDADGTLIASTDPNNNLAASLVRTVAPGSYRVSVLSHGTYGDLGQYSLSVVTQPYLTLDIAAHSISEDAGLAATTATVTRHNVDDLTQPLTVTLTNGDDTEIGIPTQVEIPPNQSSFTFNVDAIDDEIQDGTQTALITATAAGHGQASDSVDVLDTTVTTIAGRFVFYNNSYFDGKSALINAADDGAIATDKSPLLPGGKATFANYTSFSRGLNAIMIDFKGVADAEAIGASQFVFKVGNSNDPSSWTDAPAPIDIAPREGAGQDGSDRITILWADQAIQKQWLQVTVKADTVTGLASPDVFYFGNAVGESGNSTTNTFVNVFDFAGTRDNPHSFLDRAAVDDPFDFTRDSLVNVFDLAAVRDNSSNFLTALKLIDLRAGSSPAQSPQGASPFVSGGNSGGSGNGQGSSPGDGLAAGLPLGGDLGGGAGLGTTLNTPARDRRDANADGFVSPADVLFVLNRLNSRSRESLYADRADVNGDGVLSPADALNVINHLRATGAADTLWRSVGAGELEWADDGDELWFESLPGSRVCEPADQVLANW